jgi:hypothetical protein
MKVAAAGRTGPDRHSTTTLMFFGAVFEQLFLPLGDKYFAKINYIANNPTILFMRVAFKIGLS